MKKISLPLFLAIVSLAGKAQKNFEGRIDYLMVSRDSTIQLDIKAWFSGKQIKVITQVLKAPAGADVKSETFILDFGLAVIDRFKPADKKVERQWLCGKGEKQDIPSVKADSSFNQILGYGCSGYGTGKFSKQEIKDSVTEISEVELKFWYADELLFAVPDSLKMTEMIPLFSNDHIALGSFIDIKVKDFALRLNTQAKLVQESRKRLPRSIFQHPKGYTLIHNR